MRILSVDDKAENLYMLEALLRGHGHQVDSASDGMEALRLAQSGGYDVIVSDILMPRMDGFQLCRELKRDGRLRLIPFVFYTATYTDPKDAAFALSLGADRFLIKPMEPDQFVRALDDLMAEISGRTAVPAGALEVLPEDETIYLKEYNARLVAKLEKKMLDLESANKALREDIAERERQSAERTRLERQLRQAQKLEAIGTLAGGVAHDFNNILGIIVGFAEAGEMDCEEGDASKRLFAEIVRAATRGRGLTQQIMAFSRQTDQTREPVALDHAVAEAIDLARATLPAAIEIRTEFAAETSPILANATQIHQIVANLLHNAAQAIGDAAGRIVVQVANFAVSEEFAQLHPGLRPGPHARLSVGDTGRGMDAPTAERIFDPFFTTKPFGQGTGLGLSVVHGVVKACDGLITVDSTPGHGTTFHLYFPAHEKSPAPATEPAPAPSGHGERILVIDDDPAIARIVGRALERLGYAPQVFTEANAALAQIARQEFDLVLTDLAMAETTGLEVARKVWVEHPETPVVLLTGYTATLDAAKARAMGFREMLFKPFTMQELAACVRTALAQPEAT